MIAHTKNSSKTAITVPMLILASCISATVTAPLYGAALEEVIVTAQKKSQRMMDVGITMTAVGEEAIRDNRIEKTTDVVLFTANTSIKEQIPGLMPIVTIRGVGLNDYNATNSPSAGIYIDEVPLSSLALMSSEFIDLASVEVLKGPQGTLYGRNATAGTLSFRTAKPELESASFSLKAGAGNYETRELQGVLNAPINESMAMRIAIKKADQREGYWYNRVTRSDVGSRDELTARVQFLWEANDNTEVLLKLESQRSRNELGSAEFWGVIPTASFSNCPGSPLCSDFFAYTDTDGDPYRGDWSVDPSYEQNQKLATLRISHDFGFAQLTGVTGFIDFDRFYASEPDAGPAAAIEFRNSDDVKQRSSEWRLSGQQGIANWQLGVFAAVDDVDTQYAGQLGLFNTTTLSHSIQSARSRAVFSNVEWDFTDDVTVITGLRASRESKKINGLHQDFVSLPGGSLLTGAPFGSPTITLASLDDEVSETSFEWKVGINKRLSEDALLFASIAQGTKSGGFFTGAASSQLQLLPYDSETLRSYEVGVKGQSNTAALAYELSVFYYDYKDVQTFISDHSGPVPVQRLSNVDAAKIYGADIAIRWQPEFVPGLSINSNLGLLDTELDSFQGGSGLVPSGNELPDAPDLTFQLAATYRHQLNSDVELSLTLDSRYQGGTYRDAANNPLLTSESYWLSNANAKLSFADSWEISFWGKNISDESYVSQAYSQVNLGNGYRVYGAPRTYGFTINKFFE